MSELLNIREQKRNNAITLTGFETDLDRGVIKVHDQLRSIDYTTLAPLLPLLFNLKGKPYLIRDYAPFEPFFRPRQPRIMIYKTGRQLSKTTCLSAAKLLRTVTSPFHSTLFVTPLFEMIRRFSQQYVREFIERSPVKALFVSSKQTSNVLQKSFKNGASMYFSYAFLDAERTRGIPADENVIDEVQDINIDFLKIIHETMSGSKVRTRTYTGTPKSLENTLQRLWQSSSQAEWIIKCHRGGCGHWNIPNLQNDLLAMIGPMRDDITPDNPGVVCAKCRKPLRPNTGHWQHSVKEYRWEAAGYHVPQMLLPMHYGDPEKWQELLNKMGGLNNVDWTTFLNECCGEASDQGSRVITETDLRTASILPWKNGDVNAAVAQLPNYVDICLAIDWGGGGGRLGSSDDKFDKRTRTSFTVIAVLGLTADRKIHVIYAVRSLRTLDMIYEARLVAEMFKKFRCQFIAHDHTGAGDTRMQLLVQAGFPVELFASVSYCGPTKHPLMHYREPTPDHPRGVYLLDKSRALNWTCQAIKSLQLLFFEFDYVASGNEGLILDFTALVEEKVSRSINPDLYMITSNPNRTDDFAQAVNIGAHALWKKHNALPNLAKTHDFSISPADLAYIAPVNGWLDS